MTELWSKLKIAAITNPALVMYKRDRKHAEASQG